MIVAQFFRNCSFGRRDRLILAAQQVKGRRKEINEKRQRGTVTVAWDVIRTLSVIILNSERTE